MSIILVVAGAIEDRRPGLIGELRGMGEQPVPVELRTAHACVGHEVCTAGVLQQTALLSGAEGGLGGEDCGVDGGGDGVEQEEVEGAFVWGMLGAGC